MSLLNYHKDPPAMGLSFATSSEKDGVESIIDFCQKGNDEVKNLLRNECKVIYECSFCRNLFRSLINFISHKRTLCRSLHSSVRAESQFFDQISGKNAEEIANGFSKKPPPLRRFNMASSLAKHVTNETIRLEHTNVNIEIPTLPKSSRISAQTKFQDGSQVLDHIPPSLRRKNHLSEERTFIIMPEGDRATRCGDMQLRRRRGGNNGATLQCLENPQKGRELSLKEAEVINRIPSSLHADYVTLRCLDEKCIRADIPKFDNLILLAYHLTFHHSVPSSGADFPYACFLCPDTKFRSDSALKDHFDDFHDDLRKLYEQNTQLIHFHANSSSNLSEEQLNLSMETFDEEGDEADEPYDMNQNIKDDMRARLEVINKWRSQRPSFHEHKEDVGYGCPPKKAIPPPMNRSSLIARQSLSTPSPKRTPSKKGDESSQISTPRKPYLISSDEAMEIDAALNSSVPFYDQEDSIHDDQTDTEDAFNDNEARTDDGHFADFADGSDEDGGGTQVLAVDSIKRRNDADDLSQEARIGARRRQPNRRIYNEQFVDPEDRESTRFHRRSNVGSSNSAATIGSLISPKMKIEKYYDVPSLKRRGTDQQKKTPVKKISLSLTLSPSPQKKRNVTAKTSPFLSPRQNTKADNGRSPSKSPAISPVNSPMKRGTSGVSARKQLLRLSLIAVTKKNSKSPIKKSDGSRSPRKRLSRSEGRTDFDGSVQKMLNEQESNTHQHEIGSPNSNKERFESLMTQLKDSSKVKLQNVPSISPSKSSSLPPDDRHSPFCVSANNEGPERVLLEAPQTPKKSPKKASKGIVLPVPAETTTVRTPTKEQLPSRLSERNRENLAFYTPRARRALIQGTASNMSDEGNTRRKQILNADSDSMDMFMNRQQLPPRPEDLSEIPVYLTEAQRDLFFAPLKQLFDARKQVDGNHQCTECGQLFTSMKDGRRHMVSHIRVMRVRCSLCDAGSFFCSDMRIHLMFRHCEKLCLATDFVLPGDTVPCMDKKKADLLTQLVDPYNPGRVMYTSGKIVSWSNPKAHLPDPIIEERILGQARPDIPSSNSLNPQQQARIMRLNTEKQNFGHSNHKTNKTNINTTVSEPALNPTDSEPMLTEPPPTLVPTNLNTIQEQQSDLATFKPVDSESDKVQPTSDEIRQEENKPSDDLETPILEARGADHIKDAMVIGTEEITAANGRKDFAHTVAPTKKNLHSVADVKAVLASLGPTRVIVE